MPDWAFDDTATVPATVRTLVPSPINYGEDFRVISEAPGEVILGAIAAPLARPETLRIAYSEIADVFKGTKITNNLLATGQKGGISLLVQLNSSIADDNAAIFPISAHLVIKYPNGVMTPESETDNVRELVEHLLGHLYETGETSPASRIASMLRGSLTPVEL